MRLHEFQISLFEKAGSASLALLCIPVTFRSVNVWSSLESMDKTEARKDQICFLGSKYFGCIMGNISRWSGHVITLVSNAEKNWLAVWLSMVTIRYVICKRSSWSADLICDAWAMCPSMTLLKRKSGKSNLEGLQQDLETAHAPNRQLNLLICLKKYLNKSVDLLETIGWFMLICLKKHLHDLHVLEKIGWFLEILQVPSSQGCIRGRCGGRFRAWLSFAWRIQGALRPRWKRCVSWRLGVTGLLPPGSLREAGWS